MEKVTVRLDDDAFEDLQQVTQAIGVTATAYIQAIIEHAGVLWRERGFEHPIKWSTDETVDETTRSVIARAQEIDVERRNRGPSSR